jgi:hypothetical protein
LSGSISHAQPLLSTGWPLTDVMFCGGIARVDVNRKGGDVRLLNISAAET